MKATGIGARPGHGTPPQKGRNPVCAETDTRSHAWPTRPRNDACHELLMLKLSVAAYTVFSGTTRIPHGQP